MKKQIALVLFSAAFSWSTLTFAQTQPSGPAPGSVPPLNSTAPVIKPPLNQSAPSAAPAQLTSPPGTKLPPASLGVVDLQIISRDSAAAKSIREQVERQGATYAADFQKRGNDLRNAVQDLQRQRASLPQDAFQDRRAALEAQDADLQREVERRRRELDEVVADNLHQIENAVVEVVDQIRQERGLNLILHRASAIWVAPELDVTPEVLQRLDRKLPRVTVKFPAGKK